MRSIFILSFLFALYSCGQGQKSTTIKVSTGFAATNDQFQNGLVLVGSGPNNAYFSIPIAYTGGDTSVNLKLDYGTWNFKIVGWDGVDPDGFSGIFTGNTYCGTQSVNLDSSSNTVINLSATRAGCTGAIFGSAVHYDSTANLFKKIKLGTCGVLYRNSAGAALTSSDFAMTWCNESNLTKDLIGERILSARIYVPSILPADVAMGPSLSVCVSSFINGGKELPLRLPTKGLPLQIELYSGDNCSGSDGGASASYYFKEGLDSSYSFDHKIASITDSPYPIPNLYLPSNGFKKGYSAIFGLAPAILCGSAGTSSCLPAPTSLSGGVNVVTSDWESFKAGTISGGTRCSDISDVELDGLSVGTSNFECREEGDTILLSVNLSLQSNCLTSCSLQTVGPGNTFNVKNDTSRTARVFNDIYRTLGQLGVNSSALSIDSFPIFASEHKDEIVGIIGDGRGMFVPDGPAGIFDKSIVCSSYVGKKQISFLDWDGMKTYEIELKASSKAIPKLFCNNTNLNSTACTVSNFQKAMIVRKAVSPGFIAVETLHFRCDHKIGLYESQESNIEDGNKRNSQRLVGWNTSNLLFERVEAFEGSTEYFGTSSDVREARVEYSRFQRNATVPTDLAWFMMNRSYEARRDTSGSTFNERHNQIFASADPGGSTGINYAERGIDADFGSTTPHQSFNQPFADNILDNFAPDPAISRVNNALGDQVVAASIFDGTNHDLRVTTNLSGVISEFNFQVDSSVRLINLKAHINNAKKPLVTFVANVGGVLHSFLIRYDGSSDWYNSVDAISSGFSVSDSLDSGSVAAGIDGAFINETDNKFVVVQSTTSGPRQINYFYFNGSTTSGFTAVLNFATVPSQYPITMKRIINNATNDVDFYIAASAFVSSSSLDIARLNYNGSGITVSNTQIDVESSAATANTRIFLGGASPVWIYRVDGSNIVKNSYDGSTTLSTTVPATGYSYHGSNTCYNNIGTLPLSPPGGFAFSYCNSVSPGVNAGLGVFKVPLRKAMQMGSTEYNSIFTAPATFKAQ